MGWSDVQLFRGLMGFPHYIWIFLFENVLPNFRRRFDGIKEICDEISGKIKFEKLNGKVFSSFD